MFDFFCRYNPGDACLTGFNNPFLKVEAYSLLEFDVANISTDNCAIVTLNRRKNDWNDTFSGSMFTVIVYGYLFKRGSDTVTIEKRFTAHDVHDWLVSGKGIDVENFKGAYSIFIYNHELNSISVITDPLNVRYIHYCQFKGTWLFSSSLDAIIAYFQEQGVEPVLNWNSFFQHYLLDFILDEETFIKGVSVVPPAHKMEVDESGLKLTKYWDIFKEFQIEKPVYSKRESVRLINNYLKNHISNYIDTPEKSSVALTGGYDSRTLTALLGSKAPSYEYFSYGYGLSWDMSIPKKISGKLGLKFETYLLDNDFEKKFGPNVVLALSLSQGTALFTQANIPYMYQNFFSEKTSILSGLFGSELIKYPSSRGLFIDEAMFSLLFSENLEVSIDKLLSTLPSEYSQILMDNELKEQFVASIRKHPAIKNTYNTPQKFFYYLMMLGARKYFAKEIGMERPYLDNFHPYWDVDFIKLLIKTPYTWIHHWKEKKSFIMNVQLHQLYAKLIQKNNPRLGWQISSHATRPVFLTNLVFLPLLALDYLRFRKKIKSETILYPVKLHENHIKSISESKKQELAEINQQFEAKTITKKQFFKMISLSQWLIANHIKS